MKVDLDRYFALLSYQRSGTNMVGWAVETHPDMTYADEVFHRDNYANPSTLSAVLDTLATGARPPSRHGPAVPYNDPTATRILVDVKYNQVNSAVKRFVRSVPIIELVRQDDEKHFHSFVLRRFWSRNPVMRVKREFPDDLPFDRASFEAFRKRKAAYLKAWKGRADVTLYYEELCNDAEIHVVPEPYGRAICELAGVPYVPLTVPTRKSATEGVLW